MKKPPQRLPEELLSGRFRAFQDLLGYHRAKAHSGDGIEDVSTLFRRFIAAGGDRRGVRLRFDDDRGPDLGANWLTVSLDHVEQRAREGRAVSIDIDEGHCDAVFCAGLERISRPADLIGEIRRMLKGGGQVWVQTPLCSPYLRREDAPRTEYWRFTPDGLQVLLQDFDEILCSVFLPRSSPLRSWSYFYGIKPAEDIGAGHEGLRVV